MVRAKTPKEELDIRIGQRFGHYAITKALDEGGYGKVFEMKHYKREGAFAAFKAEACRPGLDTSIKLEVGLFKAPFILSHILSELNKNGCQEHVPDICRSRKHKRYHYIMVTLLGENLRTLRVDSPKQRISPKTWIRLAIQCLYGIKLVHDIGFIHRDIKPANFVMGHGGDYSRLRIVHILDFGLSRKFATRIERKWIVRRARPYCDFRGTTRYCSPNVHSGREQGRVDDLCSLMYILVEMHCGSLPWSKENKMENIASLKRTSIADVIDALPAEFREVFPMLRQANYYDRPNYSMIYDACTLLMKRLKVKFSDPYDWEKKKEVEYARARYESIWKKTPDHEDAKDFFESDPMKIDGPPPKNAINHKWYLKSLDEEDSS